MLFKEIKGNLEIKNQLILGVKNKRISQSQIFIGEKGNAKLALALAYAQYLNCENKKNNDSCNSCNTCVKYKKLLHPDLHIFFPTIKTNKIKNPTSKNYLNKWIEVVKKNPYISLGYWVDSFENENKTGKQAVIYKSEIEEMHKILALKKYESKYRIMLIWMPEKMNLEASNKLLKTLEEPPEKTIFLLVSEDRFSLLKTIKSRVQLIKTPAFTTKEIVDYLEEKNNVFDDIGTLEKITNSDLGEIIQIQKNKIKTTNIFLNFSNWMRLIYKKDIQEISKWTEEISRIGRKNQRLLCLYTLKMIRESIMYSFSNKKLLKTNQKETEFISNFFVFIHEKNRYEIIKKIDETIKAISRNANSKILFFELSLQLMVLLKRKSKFVEIK